MQQADRREEGRRRWMDGERGGGGVRGRKSGRLLYR